jgi:hypothetical protein
MDLRDEIIDSMIDEIIEELDLINIITYYHKRYHDRYFRDTDIPHTEFLDKDIKRFLDRKRTFVPYHEKKIGYWACVAGGLAAQNRSRYLRGEL